MLRRAPLVASVLLLASFAGCLGDGTPDESTDPPVDEGTDVPANGSDATDPTYDVSVGAPVLEPSLPEESTEPPVADVTPEPSPPPATTPTPPPAPPTTATPAEPTPTPPPPPPPTEAPTTPTPWQPTPPPPSDTTPPPPPPPSDPTPPPPPPPSDPTPPPPPPPSDPTPPPPPQEDDEEEAPSDAWPREGSFARYRYTGGESSPDGVWSVDLRADITLRYENGQWTGTCEGTRSERTRIFDDDPTERYRWDNTTFRETVTYAPLVAPTDVSIGQEVDVPIIVVCDRRAPTAPVTERTTHTAPRSPGGVESWYAHYQREWPEAFDAWWDTESGMVLAWDHAFRNSADHGWLIDTDRPLG